eukprot:COSAG01_NODE_53004_length_342_cov_0.847737_1_plen_86_part_10
MVGEEEEGGEAGEQEEQEVEEGEPPVLTMPADKFTPAHSPDAEPRMQCDASAAASAAAARAELGRQLLAERLSPLRERAARAGLKV